MAVAVAIPVEQASTHPVAVALPVEAQALCELAFHAVSPMPSNECVVEISALSGATPDWILNWFDCRRMIALAAMLKEGAIPSEPMCVHVHAVHPHPIMFANDEFLAFTGFSGSEIVNQSMSIIQGADADGTTDPINDLVARAAATNLAVEATIHASKTCHGIPFGHTVRIEPLTNSRNEHVLYKLTSLDLTVLLDGVTSLPE